ncbi:YtxH domain-containing protein [Paenibacillus sp. y28]|uniref:YtxH domain-containing protein n=1 Tax=Paenibacillus sp. y28 TaxID=3129110 RepID=UPI003017F5D7
MAGKRGSGVLFGSVLGGAIGAAAALLLAPQSGKAMRQSLLRGCSSAADFSRQTTRRMREAMRTERLAQGESESQQPEAAYEENSSRTAT